ncbi:MAG: hypothetical protein IPO60_09590 [Flavobacteriales bacterium]|nr:hypothetical protein [Flavobacteriales bacterium]
MQARVGVIFARSCSTSALVLFLYINLQHGSFAAGGGIELAFEDAGGLTGRVPPVAHLPATSQPATRPPAEPTPSNKRGSGHRWSQ